MEQFTPTSEFQIRIPLCLSPSSSKFQVLYEGSFQFSHEIQPTCSIKQPHQSSMYIHTQS
ncbi:hypothetical protein HanPI659440_Chr13g0509711 [Helianthus annuus]|nr:hypothetical protein HanPI659440_Chr13g0509711 [Helianthus annuus]